MMCQSCNQNLATVHLTEIIQKSKKETHLCEDCAKSKGVSYNAQFSVKDFLSGLAKAKPAESVPQITPSAAAEVAASPSEDTFQPCPSCGIAFSQFRQSGRFGCFNDYDHFRSGLVPLLEKIHGQIQHTGRIPHRIGERIRKQRMIQEQQRQLKEAVEREDYELAASLRDQIRSLESGEGA